MLRLILLMSKMSLTLKATVMLPLWILKQAPMTILLTYLLFQEIFRVHTYHTLYIVYILFILHNRHVAACLTWREHTGKLATGWNIVYCLAG